ncbi:YjbQ family protein [bacterium]|nr:YjbQ family protein [bacterium]
MHQRQLVIKAPRQGLFEITASIAEVVQQSLISRGLCHLFVQHTSASLLIQENADPSARADLESFFERLANSHSHLFTHTDEGPDDMPSHIKSALTQTSLTIPVLEGHLGLGTWQGIYLWEHRIQLPPRRLCVSGFG